jgi:hypothetical protein
VHSERGYTTESIGKDYMKYLLSLVIILGSCAAALADGLHTTVTTVPFDFVVGNKTLSAGTYCISQISSSGSPVLRVRLKDGSAAGLILPVTVDAFTGNGGPRMVFEHTGGRNVLITIVSDDRSYILARQRPPATVPDPDSTVVTSIGP